MAYTDTFCNAVDCRFELALEVQTWTRARSECFCREYGIFLREYRGNGDITSGNSAVVYTITK